MPRLVLFTTKTSEVLNVGVMIHNGTHVASITGFMAEHGGFMPLNSMRKFLEMGEHCAKFIEAASADPRFHAPVSEVSLKAPIYDPDKVICVGMNYVDHCTEQDVPVPDEPTLFSKFPSSIIANGEPIMLIPEMKKLDWEVELVIVIGKEGRRIKKEDALSHIAGYTVAHDVSARYWQLEKNGGQWMVGKTMDTFCPIGPAIVTPDEISDINNIGLRTRVNGKTYQDSSTNQLVFKPEDVIEWASKFMTLKVGDMILTGTPPGVGCFIKPEPIFLKDGDVVEVEIDEIGTISNQVVAEAKLMAGKSKL
jgi:2-keto-4-pentenoate hydratase/2-oxohepta-3-ene-1,7-dioic acid hydratase in catechol pathway